MREVDTRDANTLMMEVAAEFRRACQAQRRFLEWYGNSDETTPFAERLRRYGEMVAESEPWAASYERIRSRFPDKMDQLHALLLPIQREIFGE
jgi:hypothetical protein